MIQCKVRCKLNDGLLSDCPDVEYESDCGEDEIKCDCDCTCIPKSKICDGINDCCGKFTGAFRDDQCIDTSEKSIDEQNCPTTCEDGKLCQNL